MNPVETVVPIVALDEFNAVKDFLGTGTFVGQPPILVTAEHVVHDWGGRFGVAPWSAKRIMRADLLVKKREMDLALLEVPGYVCNEPFELAQDNEIAFTQPVVCFEYGTTKIISEKVRLHPATRLGNVTRLLFEEDLFGLAGREALELSFPALRGASGAPVVSLADFHLWGIVIANVSYHLIPAQVEITYDEQMHPIEQVQYMLPQGIAINVKHLRSLLTEVRSP